MPLVELLLETWQEKRINEREVQILKLKGETVKPKISPFKIDNEEEDNGENSKKTLLSNKRYLQNPENRVELLAKARLKKTAHKYDKISLKKQL